jgi:hypothetical protein
MRKGTMGTIWATLCAVGLSGTALAAPAAPAAPAAQAQTFACEWGVKSSIYGVVDTSKLWMKGSKIRMEKKTGAGLRIMLVRNSKGVYQVNQASNDGHKWPKLWERELPAQINMIGGPQGDPQLFLKRVKATLIRKDRYSGRPAEIWGYTMGSTKKGLKQSFRVWIASPGGQPLKLETRLPNPRGGFNVVAIDYKSYRWGMNLPDSLFEVPSGCKIVDLGRGEDLRPRTRPASLKK